MATNDPVTLAYFAGLFDGEGSICIGKAHRNRLTKMKGPHYQLQVHIGLNHLPIVEEFAKVFGGNVTPNKCMTYRVTYSGQKAAEMISKILPYLRVKRDQALLAFEFLRHRGSIGGRGYSANDQAIMDSSWEKMHTLNHRDSFAVRKSLKQLGRI